jgi:phosphoglycerol transferase
LAAVGFAGIYIDRFGYLDGAGSLEADLTRLLGHEPVVSANGRLSFFPLIDYAASLKRIHPESVLADLKAQTLQPVRTRIGSGFEGERADADSFSYSGATDASLLLLNPDQTPRSVIFDTTLEIGLPGEIGIRYPDGVSETVAGSADGTRLHRVLSVPPGASVIRVTAEGSLLAVSSSQETHFRLLNPALYDQPPTG